MKLSDIAALLDVPLISDKVLTGLSIDSRDIEPGNLFIAIQGDRFDGQDFISEAVAAGAAAVICHQAIALPNVPMIVVSDTYDALVKIASWIRGQFHIPTIALTGSNGKTTVKEMIASILMPSVFMTQGNLNNHFGVPLSILKWHPEHRHAVFELGASKRGDIAHTVAMVKPHVALINNIGPAHIEGFGSIDGVAKAKGEIYQGLASDGIAIVNDDDDYAHYWDPLFGTRTVIRFSSKHQATVYAKDIIFDAHYCARFTLVTPRGEIAIELMVPGAHQVQNALAASASVFAIGISLVDIAEGLKSFRGVAMRTHQILGKSGALIIDDTYNANLRSVLTALDLLAHRSGKRIFIFGDMKELGASSADHHRKVGEEASKLGIDFLLTCGEQSRLAALAFGPNALHYASQDELVQSLEPMLDASTSVLVKGSRSSAMENIVNQLI